MLPNPVDVPVAETSLSLARATEIAAAQARQRHPEVMPLAWFNRHTGEYSPQIPC
jgi:hypothetical protein